MKKGIFSLMMGLILAFTGLARANELTVNDGTITNTLVPVYGLYADAYLKCEYILPASQLTAMSGGTISQMTFYLQTPASGSWGVANFRVFLKEVTFESLSNYTGYADATVVYQGALDGTQSTMIVDFTTPYIYNGGNLLVGFYNETIGTYKSASFFGVNAYDGDCIQGYSYSSLSAITVNNRNFLPKTTFTYTGGAPQPAPLAVNPNPVDLGARPNNYWMRPFVVELTNNGPATYITGIDFDNNYFTRELGELVIPFAIDRNETVEFEITTGVGNGDMVSTLDVDYGDLRTAVLFDVMAYAYDPVEPDVWEMARVINAAYPFEYRNTATEGVTLYDNYLLPGDAQDGPDAVYKVTFNQDVMLNGTVTVVDGDEMAENAKMAVYTQAGIDEVGGPDLANFYVGPTIGGGSEPYDIILGEGTSTTGYLPFYTFYNYSLSQQLYLASNLQEAGMGAGVINTIGFNNVNSYDYNVNNIKIWMANVTDDNVSATSVLASGMTLVYDGASYNPIVGWNDFELNGNFAWDGTSNLLVLFQRNDGQWHSGPYWQCTAQSYNAGAYVYQDSYAYNAESTTYSLTTTTNLANTHFVGGGRGNRDGNVLTYNFDDGTLQGWTTIDADGDGYNWRASESFASYSGSYAAVSESYRQALSPNNYLVSPQLTLGEGASISFYEASYWAYEEPIYLMVSTTGTNPSDFTSIQNWTFSNDHQYGFEQQTVDLSAYAGQQVYLAFRHYGSYDQYAICIDDITIDLGGTPGPVPPTPEIEYIIDGMTMVPGTYYIAASSTDSIWDVVLNATELPCPEIASNPSPADDADELEPAAVNLTWTLGQYTTEYRLVFGSTYYCEDVLVDWTTDLAQSYTVRNLYNNTNYFWRVDERNGNCETLGQVWGFTTHLNVPQNLRVADETIFEGQSAVLSWNAIQDRTYRYYNIYQDNELIASTPANQVTTTYTVEGLTYNMDGYSFYVTAVYDEGESAPSNEVNVKVSGNGSVAGHVYEQDSITGIANATVTFTGVDEFGDHQTFSFITDATGAYGGAIMAGEFNGMAECSGYQPVNEPSCGNPVDFTYAQTTSPVDFVMNEVYTPVGEVIAEYYPDPEDPESPYVKVYWGWNVMSSIIEDFETGDFSQYEWNIPAQYPFEITTTNPYEGTYCMQSTNYNVASSTSSIDVTVEIPRAGLMSFYERVSCESSWDMAYFYMDGVQMATFTGTSGWGVKEVSVTEGTHNFKWAYTKDSSVNSGEDRFFIDYIDFIHDAQPLEPGWIYYDNGVNVDAIGLTAGGSFMWGVRFPASMMSSFSGCSLTKVSLFDYEAHTGNVMIYQGGATAPGTLIHQQPYTCTGSNDFVETTLTSALPIDPTQDLWVVMNNNNGQYVASACDDTGDPNGRFISIDGVEWDDVAALGLPYTWMIRAYVSDGAKSRAISSDDAISAIKPEYNLSGASLSDLTIDPAQTEPVVTGQAMSNDRSFQYFRVYRTDCYNDGPYTPENTVVCCCELHDTLYIDVEWPDLRAGVYKWGVGCVYGGNRESEITWSEPTMVPGEAETATRDEMTYDFEDGTMQGWTTIDADGDGFNWMNSADLGITGGHNGSQNFVYSQSYDNNYGVLYPDNYLVSPQIQLGGSISFWACGQDASYSAEHFGVAVSTTGNTNASDFTTIYENTIAAKGTRYEGERGMRDQSTWTQYTVDLSAYSGMGYVALRHFNCYDEFYLDVDDVTITPGSGAPVPPTPGTGLQEERESEIVWSNCLDKDMYLNGGVDITVLLNSADSPEGVNVSFTNLNEGEQELYPVEPVVLDGTGYYAWDSFRKGDYVVNVTLDGYEPITDTVNLWEPYSMRYVMIEIIYGVNDLYVSHTGWAMWAGEDPVGPNPGPTPGEEFTFGFEEDPAANGWTIQQLNETSWVRQEGATGFGAAPHEGNYHMWLHWAYGDQDEWLITPEFTVPANGNLNFWTYATLGSTYGDHYYAKITVDGGNTWNVLWDATAQPAGTNYYTSPINCDLSAYAGQTAKIAWQGVMADGLWYAWCIDDITVSGGREVISFDGRQWFRQETNTTEVGEPVAYSKAGDVEPRNGERHLEGYKVLCTSIDGEPIFSGNTVHPFIQVDTEELVEGENYICKVAAIYSTGMSDWTEAIWQYKSCENYGEAQNVAAEGQTVTWEYPGTPGPVPPTPGEGDEFSFSFDSNADGWTTINADGDDHNWYHSSEAGNHSTLAITSHSGAGHMMSESYCNATWAALHPDEYLVAPQMYSIAAGSTFSFYACAQDESYAAEHFGVAISTTGNTNAADFTTINEWTLTAKGGAKANPAATRNGKGTREGNWYQYTADLSAYAGQQVWIAIRHFGCSDMFIMCMDDAQLTSGAKSNRDVIVFNGYVTDPGAMANGADASWIKGGQSTWGPNVNNGGGYMLGDSFTLSAATTISEIEVYGYQTGSTTTSTFTGLYAQIYNGNPMNGATAVWGDMTSNIMTATAFTNCYRGSDGETTATTRPIMSITASNLNIQLEAGTYYLVYSLAGTGSSGPWGAPHAEPVIGNTGNGIQYTTEWVNLTDSGSGETYGCAMKITGGGGAPVPPTPTGEVLGAMIFRDGEWLAEVAYPTSEYTDEEAYGEHEYCVRIIYNGTNILPDQNEYYSMSCPVCVGGDLTCEPGAPIRGEYFWNEANDFGALISWGEQAEPIAEWLYYDNGTNEDAIGLTGGGSFYWGIMIPSSQLGAYAGCSLTKVSLFDYTAHTGKVIIYQGGSNAPGTPIHQDNYTMTGSSNYVEVALSAALPIDPSQNLWIVFNNNDGDYVASCCANTGDANGRWISLDGASWEDVASYGLSNTWQIRGYVTNMAKGAAVTAIEAPALNGTPNGILTNAGISKQGNHPAFANRAEIVKYNIYRSTDNINYELIASVDAIDGTTYYEYSDATAAGVYYYQVRALYSNGCESEPAASEANPDNNYVIVNVTSVAENGEIALYPNPTNGNITIQAQNMNRITVVSVLGQVVYDAEVDGDEYHINMAQFNAGVYMVRIATENGVSTQRVTVVK